MSKIQGQNVVVLIKDGAWKAVAFMTVCELDESVSTIETGSADSGKWRRVKPKKHSWQMTSGYLVSNAEQAVYLDELMDNETRIQVAFCEVPAHPEPMSEPPVYRPDYLNDHALRRSGFCYITRMTETARNRDFVTRSVTFTGDGELWRDLHELADFNADFNNDFNN